MGGPIRSPADQTLFGVWDRKVDEWVFRLPPLTIIHSTSAIKPRIEIISVPWRVYELFLSQFIDRKLKLTLAEFDFFLGSKRLQIGIGTEQT